MAPKKKAQELLNRFEPYVDTFHKGILENAKQCALIAVDELIKESCKGSNFKDPYYQDGEIQYWIEVKQEINNL